MSFFDVLYRRALTFTFETRMVLTTGSMRSTYHLMPRSVTPRDITVEVPHCPNQDGHLEG